MFGDYLSSPGAFCGVPAGGIAEIGEKGGEGHFRFLPAPSTIRTPPMRRWVSEDMPESYQKDEGQDPLSRHLARVLASRLAIASLSRAVPAPKNGLRYRVRVTWEEPIRSEQARSSSGLHRPRSFHASIHP